MSQTVNLPDIGDIEIDFAGSVDPRELPPWYNQFLSLPDKKRKEIIEKELLKIKEEKPDAFAFIKKFKTLMVGVAPQISYALPDSSQEDPSVTWIHSFSRPTLLFWCKQGGFGFFVNANLEYNDSVLNKVRGNKRENLRGFTS